VSVLFIEGIPGSGKTTSAEAIAQRFVERGRDAAWWREEDADHPATPKTLRRSAARPDFAQRCLAGWEAFAARNTSRAGVAVLEGSAFQSTLRFLLEYGAPRTEMLAYVRGFDGRVARSAPRMIHLEQPDPRRHLEEFVYPTRGAEWVAKVSGYLAGTPFCRAHGWSGREGMTRFWLLYRELCDAAIAELRMPVLRVEAGPGRWTEARARILDWLEQPGDGDDKAASP
jgi:hypothetical protein